LSTRDTVPILIRKKSNASTSGGESLKAKFIIRVDNPLTQVHKDGAGSRNRPLSKKTITV
jgi:hypothetical protein